ncbi:hypothetical protein N0V90_004386 [Kalmusia sp. IMI 367209]|nr:hypothetical protein N0V90_004386 [Kalmusia sp. IMI 367209]
MSEKQGEGAFTVSEMKLASHLEEHGLQTPPMQPGEEAALRKVLVAVGIPQELCAPNGDNGYVMQDDTSRNINTTTINHLVHRPVLDGDSARSSEFMSAPARQDPANIELSTFPDVTQKVSPGMHDIPEASRPDHGASQSVDSSLTVDSGQLRMNSNLRTEDDFSSECESVEKLVQILSDRMGSLYIGSGGQIRYYGPTSDFSLLNMPSADPIHVHRSIRNDGQDYLDRLDVGAECPAELEHHLVNLYFTWQDASFHVVDRAMYEMGKSKWHREMEDTPYYSEALRNAM